MPTGFSLLSVDGDERLPRPLDLDRLLFAPCVSDVSGAPEDVTDVQQAVEYFLFRLFLLPSLVEDSAQLLVVSVDVAADSPVGCIG